MEEKKELTENRSKYLNNFRIMKYHYSQKYIPLYSFLFFLFFFNEIFRQLTIIIKFSVSKIFNLTETFIQVPFWCQKWVTSCQRIIGKFCIFLLPHNSGLRIKNSTQPCFNEAWHNNYDTIILLILWKF